MTTYTYEQEYGGTAFIIKLQILYVGHNTITHTIHVIVNHLHYYIMYMCMYMCQYYCCDCSIHDQ